MTAQFVFDFGGSRAVPNRFEPAESHENPESVHNGSEPVRNRSGNSSMIPAVREPLSKEREKTPNRSTSTGPATGEESRSFASALSLPPDGRRDRALEPAVVVSTPVSGDQNRANRSAEPPTLRPYQLAAIAAIHERFESGEQRTLVVLPTGTGKTVVFAECTREVIATVAIGRVLVLAHRTELLEQAQRKLADVGIAAKLEKAEQRAGNARVVVASVQTLRGKRLEKLNPADFRLLIVDEGHHGVAESYRQIFEHFPGVRILFVTATPDRADGKGLEEVCSSVAYRYELRQAITDGWLVKLRARRIVVDGLDLSRVKTTCGDLDAKDLGAIMRLESNLHGVVDPLIRESAGRRTIVFAVDVAHAKALAEILNRHEPGCALAVDGTASDGERKAALGLFRHGEIRFLVNCALFTEGFDEPSVACVAIARPTKSRALHTQMVGRGTRLLGLDYAASVIAGKSDCLVLDFVGNTGRHKLVGPADALAGNADLAEEVREQIERLTTDKQLELEDAMAQAEAEVARKQQQAKLVAVVHYRASEIDLFLGGLPGGHDPWDGELATENQLVALESAGFQRPPHGLTKFEASQMLDAIAQRRSDGLASLKQCRVLAKLGLDTKGMTMQRAGQLIGMAQAKGWRPFTFLGQPEYRGRR